MICICEINIIGLVLVVVHEIVGPDLDPAHVAAAVTVMTREVAVMMIVAAKRRADPGITKTL